MNTKHLFSFITVLFLTSLTAQEIIIDGNKSDWNNVPIISESGVFPYTKVHVSGDSLLFMMQFSQTAPETSIQHVNYTPDQVTI